LNSPTILCGCVVNFKASRSFSPAVAFVIYPRMPEPRCDSQKDFHLDLTLNLSAGAFHLRVWGRVFHDALHSNDRFTLCAIRQLRGPSFQRRSSQRGWHFGTVRCSSMTVIEHAACAFANRLPPNSNIQALTSHKLSSRKLH
jgi:hypothetical protein